ncbi:hypothetical protein 3 [Hubei insect virus 2]|uniref:hypothetical protein 3 n=1 Tax=Hubei insect virus 2 TaxID=1922898 RepID=UPI00090C5E09|nr:hypothetical protein 3 [Hubei insect virus 2]APG79060.1 hypothetical protein 3 [Hubei insect virus 2]
MSTDDGFTTVRRVKTSSRKRNSPSQINHTHPVRKNETTPKLVNAFSSSSDVDESEANSYPRRKLFGNKIFNDLNVWDHLFTEYGAHPMVTVEPDDVNPSLSGCGLFFLQLYPVWWSFINTRVNCQEKESERFLWLKERSKSFMTQFGLAFSLCGVETLQSIHAYLRSALPDLQEMEYTFDPKYSKYLPVPKTSKKFNYFVSYCLSMTGLSDEYLTELFNPEQRSTYVLPEFDLCDFDEQVDTIIDIISSEFVDLEFPALQVKSIQTQVDVSCKKPKGRTVSPPQPQAIDKIEFISGYGVLCNSKNTKCGSLPAHIKMGIVDRNLPYGLTFADFLTSQLAHVSNPFKSIIVMPLINGSHMAYGSVVSVWTDVNGVPNDTLFIYTPMLKVLRRLVESRKIILPEDNIGKIADIMCLKFSSHALHELAKIKLDVVTAKNIVSQCGLELMALLNSSTAREADRGRFVVFSDPPLGSDSISLPGLPFISIVSRNMTVYSRDLKFTSIISVRSIPTLSSIMNETLNAVIHAETRNSIKRSLAITYSPEGSKDLDMSGLQSAMYTRSGQWLEPIPYTLRSFEYLLTPLLKHCVKFDTFISCEVRYEIDKCGSWKFCCAKFSYEDYDAIENTALELQAIYCYHDLVGMVYKYKENDIVRYRISGNTTSLIDPYLIGDALITQRGKDRACGRSCYMLNGNSVRNFSMCFDLSADKVKYEKMAFLVHYLFQNRVISYFQYLLKIALSYKLSLEDHEGCDVQCITSILVPFDQKNDQARLNGNLSDMSSKAKEIWKHGVLKLYLDIPSFFPGKKTCTICSDFAISPCYPNEFILSCCKRTAPTRIDAAPKRLANDVMVQLFKNMKDEAIANEHLKSKYKIK